MKKMLKYYALFILAIFIVGCNTNTNQQYVTSHEVIDTVTQNGVIKDEIATSLINNCYSCHTPQMADGIHIAPSMLQVKEHYLDKYPEKQTFVKAMSAFVNAPSNEKAIMFESLNKFGVMPNMQFPKQEVEKIINYIYDNDIDTDDWLKTYYKISNKTYFPEDDYLLKGRHIAITTKNVLGKNLKSAITTKGTKEAVKFCNLKAYPLTDSMAVVYHTNIKRVSDRNRNPNNTATEKEITYINSYQNQLKNGEELQPIIEENNQNVLFYMPIVTNDMCLQCHGTKNEIDIDVLNEIMKLYPNDKATGYDINQIRGLWRIEMVK
jgi:nitrate reductase cytochrome c-type subunit